jgi:hypothetical protein
LLRSDVHAGKYDIISAAMQFTDAEPIGFRPIYQGKARDQQMIGGQRFTLIKDFATKLRHEEDDKAKDMMQR